MASFFVVDGMGPYDLLLISLSSNKIHPCGLECSISIWPRMQHIHMESHGLLVCQTLRK